MKLKLDENLGELGRDVLMAKGHDVSTVAMLELLRSRNCSVTLRLRLRR